MLVAVLPTAIRALGTIHNMFIKGLKEREKRIRALTILTSAFLRSSRILRRVLEI